MPVEGEAGLGYMMRSGYELPPLMFTEDEIEALVFGARMVRAWGDAAFTGAADAAVSKIRAVLPDRLGRIAETTRLTVAPGYLWDGSSGPTIDGEADPVPSLVHDVLYEAMRAGKLHKSQRAVADSLYYDLLRERGMSWLRAGARYWGLRLFAGYAASRTPEYPKRSAT